MKIIVLTGAPGSQKTRTMLREVARNPDRYLIAVPRINLIDEHRRFILDTAMHAGMTPPLIREAHSGRRGKVQRQLNDATREVNEAGVGIAFVTHDFLRTANLLACAGWHARIDEIPDTIRSGVFRAAGAERHLAPLYDLEQVTEQWSLALGQTTLSPAEILNDDSMTGIATFHKEASNPNGVYVNVQSWADLKGRREKVHWWSLWSPRDMKQFASVQIACASFRHSLCNLVLTEWWPDEVVIEERVIDSQASRARPSVRVHYFTEGHTGSSEYWATSEGRASLNRVARFFERGVPVGYWSGNEVLQTYLEHRFDGELVSPKLAGTNSLIDHTSCLFLYSNKPQDADAAVMNLFGTSGEQIKRARETEDIIQFVMRGAIRRPDFGGRYDVFLYDLQQAEALQSYLEEAGVTGYVELIPEIDACIMDVHRGDDDKRTPAERLQSLAGADRRRKEAANQRQQRKRRKDREAGAAAGTLRPRGRPAKNSPHQ